MDPLLPSESADGIRSWTLCYHWICGLYLEFTRVEDGLHTNVIQSLVLSWGRECLSAFLGSVPSSGLIFEILADRSAYSHFPDCWSHSTCSQGSQHHIPLPRQASTIPFDSIFTSSDPNIRDTSVTLRESSHLFQKEAKTHIISICMWYPLHPLPDHLIFSLRRGLPAEVKLVDHAAKEVFESSPRLLAIPC